MKYLEVRSFTHTKQVEFSVANVFNNRTLYWGEFEEDGAYRCFVVDMDCDCTESPREWDNLSTLAMCDKLRHLENKNKEAEVDKFESRLDELANGEMTREEFDKEYPIVLKIYAYSHGGLTLSTSPFSDPWDSGCAGLAFVSRATLEENLLTPKDAILNVKGEIEILDSWINGNVVGYRVFDEKGYEVDSCWDFILTDDYTPEDVIREYISDDAEIHNSIFERPL